MSLGVGIPLSPRLILALILGVRKLKNVEGGELFRESVGQEILTKTPRRHKILVIDALPLNGNPCQLPRQYTIVQ
jgi:hypothetical protein